MKKLYLYILLLLCIIVIGAFSTISHITIKYYKNNENYRLSINTICISKIYDNLKSCDIILFEGYRNPIGGILCNSHFEHAGIVVKYDDDDIKKYKLKHNLYVVELGFKRPYFHPLPLRIKKCGSGCSIISLNKEITKSMNKKLLKLIHTNIQKIYHIYIFKYQIKKIFNRDIILSHCFHYIFYLLDNIKLSNNLLKKYNLLNSLNGLYNIYNENLNYDYKYSKGVHIIYDLYN
jgi:hypothetical protein